MQASTYIYVIQSLTDNTIGGAYKSYDGALAGLREYLIDYEMTEEEVEELDKSGQLDTVDGVGEKKLTITEVPYFSV